MTYVNPDSIIHIFSNLNALGLNYILIRNINGELPANLRRGKDIDLLIPYNERKEFINFLIGKGFSSIRHPHCNKKFLYSVNKFEFFINKNKVLFDLNYQLACQSLNAREWIPLDKKIQDSAWKNKKLNKIDGFTFYSLSAEDEFITLVTRSIFDKKEFKKDYIKRIEDLIKIVDVNDVIDKFKIIFFKFSPVLLTMLKNRQYEMILDQYISFSKY